MSWLDANEQMFVRQRSLTSRRPGGRMQDTLGSTRMSFEVQLAYFRSATGKFLTFATCTVEAETLVEIWEEIHELRRLGRLPGLRPNAGRDLYILVDVIKHPERQLHLVMPPFVNEEDTTPIRVPTGEMTPLVRMPLEELPDTGRTSTKDVVKVDPAFEEETTPVEIPLKQPKPDKPE
jgi:hypothetical protein